jgi:hypothetical protein
MWCMHRHTRRAETAAQSCALFLDAVKPGLLVLSLSHALSFVPRTSTHYVRPTLGMRYSFRQVCCDLHGQPSTSPQADCKHMDARTLGCLTTFCSHESMHLTRLAPGTVYCVKIHCTSLSYLFVRSTVWQFSAVLPALTSCSARPIL